MKHPVGDKNALILECSLQKNSLVSESRANDGQTAPYPSLAVRARNGGVADDRAP